MKGIWKWKKALVPWFFLFPSLAGVSLFLFLPFSDVVRRSFCDSMGKVWQGGSNYRMVLSSDAFLLAVKNTVRFLAVSLPLLLLFSLLLALLLFRQRVFQGFLKSVILLPAAVPAASAAFLFEMLFHQKGVVNGWLQSGMGKAAGAEFPIDFLGSGKAFWILVMIYLWKNIGYDMVLWLSGLAGIPEAYYEAARVDGAGELKSLWYITLPLLAPQTSMLIILSLINSFKIFREAYLLTGNYPSSTSIYLMQHVFNNWFTSLDIQKMSAGAVMMAVCIFLISWLFQKASEEKEEPPKKRRGFRRKRWAG